MLLEILTEQFKSIDNIGVRSWYEVIIAHATLSLLTLVGIYHYANRRQYIKRLLQLNIYPLSTSKADKKAQRKIQMINLSPRLFLWLLSLKNKK